MCNFIEELCVVLVWYLTVFSAVLPCPGLGIGALMQFELIYLIYFTYLLLVIGFPFLYFALRSFSPCLLFICCNFLNPTLSPLLDICEKEPCSSSDVCQSLQNDVSDCMPLGWTPWTDNGAQHAPLSIAPCPRDGRRKGGSRFSRLVTQTQPDHSPPPVKADCDGITNLADIGQSNKKGGGVSHDYSIHCIVRTFSRWLPNRL